MSNGVSISSLKQTETVVLPKSGVTITLKSVITVGEIRDADKISDRNQAGMKIILDTILDWDLYEDDEKQKKAPISEEFFNLLPVDDFKFLSDKIMPSLGGKSSAK